TWVAAGDLNGDGFPDLAATMSNGKVAIVMNRGAPAPLAVAPPVGGAALGLRAHPNPTRGSFVIAFSALGPGPAELEVLDVMGRRVARRHVNVTPGLQEIRVEQAGTLAAGVYLMRLTHGGRAYTGRVAVLR